MDWMIKIRTEKSYTQEALAFTVKCNQGTIANIENGKRLPSVKLAKKIAEVLEFDWTKFYENK